MLIASVCILSVASFVSCNDEKDEIKNSILVNGLESSVPLQFEGLFNGKTGIDFKQTVKVQSTVPFTISGVPDWLSISPLSGNGAIDVTIYPKEENLSSTSRTATINLTGVGCSATVKVTQEAGLSSAKVSPLNLVALYDQIGWELTTEGDVNTFQIVCICSDDLRRLTDKELLLLLQSEESAKYVDDYMFFYSYDSYGYDINPNTEYYICSVAYDAHDKRGEIVKTKIVTPSYSNSDNDAWVSISDVQYNISSYFQFTATKQGFCDKYHVIYGNLGKSYPSIAFVFEINYYIKNRKKHWLAQNWELEIITNYPNTHTFVYETSDLYLYPYISICTWGVFGNGTLSSDAMMVRGDVSEDRAPMRGVSRENSKHKNMIILRSEDEKSAREFQNK